MQRIFALLASLCCFTPVAAEESDAVFELRTYHANEGKLEELLTRFRDHTVALFDKHGMTNVGYWVPVQNEENLLIYLLSYPDQDARDIAWQGFLNDPTWKEAYASSVKEGKLVAKIDSVFLTKTDFSGEFSKADGGPRIFEMRTYTTTPKNLPILHKRFQDHTCKLFEKHGMTNLSYFNWLPEQANSENLLTYFLVHKDEDAAKASWNGFRNDPEWKKVAAASKEEAGGPILVKNGVQSVMMKATDFSPIK